MEQRIPGNGQRKADRNGFGIHEELDDDKKGRGQTHTYAFRSQTGRFLSGGF